MISFVLAGETEGNGVDELLDENIEDLVDEALEESRCLDDAVVKESFRKIFFVVVVVVVNVVIGNGNCVELGAKVGGGRGEALWIKAFIVLPTKTK